MKSSLASTGSSASKGLKEAFTALAIAAKKISSDLSQSPKWRKSVSELGNQSMIFVSSLGGAAADKIGEALQSSEVDGTKK